MKKNKNILLVCLLGLLVMAGCSDDDTSTSSPFEQEEIQTPVVPPSIDLGFDQTDVSITEGGDTVKLSLNLSIAAPVGGTITVAVDEANSSATATDYSTNLIGDIAISEGDEAKEFYIVAVDDDVREDDKTLTLTVSSNESRLSVSETTVVVTISSNEQVLVVVEKETGKVFEINPQDTSDSTFLFTITHEVEVVEETRGLATEMVPLEGIRSFVFDDETGAGYAGLSDDYDSYIYSVNMSNGTAVLWNDNNDSEDEQIWEGAADLLVGEHDIYVSSGNHDSHTSITGIDKSDAVASEPRNDGDFWTGGNALVWGGKTDSVYLGGDAEIYRMSILNGGVAESYLELTTEDDEIEGFDEVMGMVETTDGTIYALIKLRQDGPDDHFLATIDLTSGDVTFLGFVRDASDEDDSIKQGLALIPEDVL